MKSFLLGLMILGSVSAEAAVQKYIVQDLNCVGKINQKPAYMQDDYVKMVLKVTSFRSMRKDGTLADSAEFGIAYFHKNAKVDRYTDRSHEGWFGSSLLRDGTTVFNSDRDLNLVIVEGAEKTLGRMKLKGTYGRTNTPVGSYFYNLDCYADVVKKTSRIDDYTNR